MKALNSFTKIIQTDENSLDVLLERSRMLSRREHGKTIRFYAPSFSPYRFPKLASNPLMFPSISITGDSCTLMCKHCKGKLLKGMIPAKTPGELVRTCRLLKEKGSSGCLISGGCLPDGSVPLDGFADALATIKKDLGLTIVVHTGLVDAELAVKMKNAGVDAVLVDIIGSDETIREVYNLNGVKVDDYTKTLDVLSTAGVTTIPHVLVGIHYGRIVGEPVALDMISRYDPPAVVFIVFKPLKNTPMRKFEPPAPSTVAKVLAAARLMLPKTPLVLGCVRPAGAHRVETDTLAVKAGINGIAYPAEEAISLAVSLGMEPVFTNVCCSQIYQDYIST